MWLRLHMAVQLTCDRPLTCHSTSSRHTSIVGVRVSRAQTHLGFVTVILTASRFGAVYMICAVGVYV